MSNDVNSSETENGADVERVDVTVKPATLNIKLTLGTPQQVGDVSKED